MIAPENGKPFLKDSPGVFFSISHTEGMAVCAVCSHPVGDLMSRSRKPSKQRAGKEDMFSGRIQLDL